MKILIQKFGGSSLASIERIRQAAGITEAAVRQGYHVVAVASAMGDTTDDLLSLTAGFDLSRSRRELDMLLATGEQVSTSLLAIALQSSGMNAQAFTGMQAGITTDSFHGSAEIKQIKPERILDCLKKGSVAVIAGYQGMTKTNDITTLGRGGSDTTAVAIASALHAERCDIYTDVNGIYSSDPRIIPQAVKLNHIPVDKMLLLAQFGAQVMATSSMQLAARHHVPLRVRSVFSPDDTGTLISQKEDNTHFYGLAIDSKQDVFTLPSADSMAELQNQSLLLSRLREYGLQTDIVRRIRKRNHWQGVLLSTSSRHLFASKKLVFDLAGELGVPVLYKGNLAKLTAVGTFGNSVQTLHEILAVLLRERICPLYWSADDHNRVSIMLRRDQLMRTATILHEQLLSQNTISNRGFATAKVG